MVFIDASDPAHKGKDHEIPRSAYRDPPSFCSLAFVAYGMLRPPIIVAHPPAPAANSQSR